MIKLITIIREKKIAYKSLAAILILGMIYFICRVIYSVYLGLDYPNELLEASNVALTKMFMEGKSPYSLRSLGYDYPAVNYEYPFMGSLLSAAIAPLVGRNAVLAHYIVSFISFIGTGIIGYLMVKPYAKTIVAPIATAFLFLLCHWRYGFISASPDDLGLFLLVLTIYLSVNERVKHKPLVCAVLTTICFYTKQYLIFVAVGLFIYMLLYSKKEAIRYALITIVLNIAVATLVMVFWPLYFTYSVYFLYFGTMTGAGFGLSNLWAQLKYLIVMFVGLLAIITVALAWFVKKRRAEGKKIIDISVAENNTLAMCAIQIPAMMIPLVALGRNDGAFISYFLQLWMPSIIVVTFIMLEKMADDNDKLVFQICYCALVSFTVLFAYKKLPLHILTQDEIAKWRDAYETVEEYKEKGEVYYSRHLAYLALDNNDHLILCGHDGEVSPATIEVWNNSKLAQTIFPYAGDIINKNYSFQRDIIYKAYMKELSLIIFENGNDLMFGESFLDDDGTYSLLKRISLQHGNMPYTVSFYVLAQ